MGKLRHKSNINKSILGDEHISLADHKFIDSFQHKLKQPFEIKDGSHSQTFKSMSVEPIYITKEVQVEKIVYVDRPVEIYVTKEIVKEVIKEVPVYKEREVIFQEVVKEVEVPTITVRNVTVEKFIDRPVVQEIIRKSVPAWVWSVMVVEAAIALALIIK